MRAGFFDSIKGLLSCNIQFGNPMGPVWPKHVPTMDNYVAWGREAPEYGCKTSNPGSTIFCGSPNG